MSLTLHAVGEPTGARSPHGSLDFDAPPAPAHDQRAFRNLLCVLHSVDGDDLVGVSKDEARAFIKDPVRRFLRADDATCAAIWDAMMLRVRP